MWAPCRSAGALFLLILPSVVLLSQGHASPPRLHRGRAIGAERREICRGAIGHFCGLAAGCGECVQEHSAELAHAGCRRSEAAEFCRPSPDAPALPAGPPPPPCDLPVKWQSFCPKPPVCVCDDKSLCESLPPSDNKWENFAFHTNELYGANGTETQHYDWGKVRARSVTSISFCCGPFHSTCSFSGQVTLVGMYDGGSPYDYGKLQCTAHSHGARIMDWNIAR